MVAFIDFLGDTHVLVDTDQITLQEKVQEVSRETFRPNLFL